LLGDGTLIHLQAGAAKFWKISLLRIDVCAQEMTKRDLTIAAAVPRDTQSPDSSPHAGKHSAKPSNSWRKQVIKLLDSAGSFDRTVAFFLAPLRVAVGSETKRDSIPIP
jgi:hypothetical protein